MTSIFHDLIKKYYTGTGPRGGDVEASGREGVEGRGVKMALNTQQKND